MSNIQPHYYCLDDLFSRRLFRIPHYQRAYSWQHKQRHDMFEDIKQLKDKSEDSFHFLAMVVGRKHKKTTMIEDTQYSVIDIVDGQQRLTTLVLLLKAIEQKLGCSEAQLAQKLQELFVKQDDVSLILLRTNHDQSEYFVNFLRYGQCPPVEAAQTLAERELLRAINHCKDFVNDWADQADLIELLRIIKNRLMFVFYEIDDEAAVYTVFEVLNNRGLYVSWLDRLKSMLMSVAFEDNPVNSREHIDELHSIWGQIYYTIGLNQGTSTESLRFGATLKSPSQISKPLGEEQAVESLRSQGKNTAKAIEVSKWLLALTRAVNRFLEEMKGSREAVTEIAHARLLAVAIILQNFPLDQEKELLDQWEKTTFHIFGLCRKDARTGVGDYVRLAWNTLNNSELNTDKIAEEIQKIRKNYSFDSVRDQLKNKNCYEGWEDELRYLLFRYEEYLAEQQGQTFMNEQWNRIWQGSAVGSIEHIHPQSKGSQEPLEANEEGVFVHRLGNLLLLPPNLNSQLSDKDPEEKADAYINTGLLIAKEVGLTIKQSGWGTEQIKEREKQLIKWIQREWS